MIQARFTRQHDGRLQHVQISGHAGSGPYGYDIVCAAVSALAINFINSLTEIVRVQAEVEINEIDGGFISVTLPNQLEPLTSQNAQLLFEAFLLGMNNLSDNASDFVKTQVIEKLNGGKTNA
ncbi:ribosomal-processing cysteine protease Prp [Streptococcus merionis]|uniref:ribosomal-processing cysteine protease Prp n=1 Tax=Streptococcus merionis TaxID=400065 RepID=UPI003514E898